MIFDDKKNQTIMFASSISEEFKMIIAKVFSQLPQSLTSKTQKGKKIKIQNEYYKAQLNTYKEEGTHQDIFNYCSQGEEENRLKSLEMTLVEINEKYLDMMPIYRDIDIESGYDYNCILSFEYTVNKVHHDYEFEIRKLNQNNFAIVVNYYKNCSNKGEEKEILYLTKNELLSRVDIKSKKNR